jgi:chromosome partitioning protein
MVNNNIIDNIVNTNITNFNIVPSVVDLSAAELELINYPNKEFVLNKLVQQIEHNYDYIIIDCPPSLGMLTINALTTCRDIIVPLQCEFFALEGLSHLLNTVKLVKSRLNNDLTILGILLTMYDRRNRITEEVEQDVRHYLGDLVFKTVIPRNSKLSEAPSHGVPAILYDHKCIGARSYAYLVKEILSKVKLAEQVGVLVNE